MVKKKNKKLSINNTFLRLLGNETPDLEDFHKHYWADYIELKCLVNKDKEFTQAELIDICKEDDLKPKKNDTSNDSLEIFAHQCYNLIKYRERTFW